MERRGREREREAETVGERGVEWGEPGVWGERGMMGEMFGERGREL